jgi:hypothetical protein
MFFRVGAKPVQISKILFSTSVTFQVNALSFTLTLVCTVSCIVVSGCQAVLRRGSKAPRIIIYCTTIPESASWARLVSLVKNCSSAFEFVPTETVPRGSFVQGGYFLV